MSTPSSGPGNFGEGYNAPPPGVSVPVESRLPHQVAGQGHAPRPVPMHSYGPPPPSAPAPPATSGRGTLVLFTLLGLFAGFLFGICSVGGLWVATSVLEEESHSAGVEVVEGFITDLEKGDYRSAWGRRHPLWFMHDSAAELEEEYAGLFRYLGTRVSLDSIMTSTFIDSDGDECLFVLMGMSYDNGYSEASFRLYKHPASNTWQMSFFSIPSSYWSEGTETRFIANPGMAG